MRTVRLILRRFEKQMGKCGVRGVSEDMGLVWPHFFICGGVADGIAKILQFGDVVLPVLIKMLPVYSQKCYRKALPMLPS